jgi:hypothetical protein
VIEPGRVVELAEEVKGERAAVGLLVSPYAAVRGVADGLDVPLELIDGPRLRELVARHLPARLPDLERFAAFEVASEGARPLESQPA